MSAENLVRARIWVTGRVQGVGYRAFVQRVAIQSGLSGGVKNLDDGRVEVDVEGSRQQVEQLIERLKVGPPAARVGEVTVKWEPPTEQRGGFQIRS
jgi:acylphosphatase